MWPTVLLILYCGLIVLASLGGGWLPSLMRLTHRRMQVVMSGVAGLMLGVGTFHMLPHSIAQTGSIDISVGWMVAGLLVMFFLIRALQFHQHDVANPDDAALSSSPHLLIPSSASRDDPHDEGMRGTGDEGTDPQAAAHHLSWFGVALGLALHSLIDGMALAASVQAETAHPSAGVLLGLGTFLAILLHKPLDALSITSLMLAGGWSAGSRQAVNTGFAMMCPVGAALFILSLGHFSEHGPVIVGCALGFSAGVFLCISLSDLLPELQFHSHDQLKLSAALLLGVLAAYGIGFLEPRHVHAPDPPTHEHSGERHESRGLKIED